MVLDLRSVAYFVLILALGGIILFLRRKAKGTRASYRISLILLGLLLSTFIFQGILESGFVHALNILVLILLTYELSIRFNADNIKLKKNLLIFLCLALLNIFILTFFAMFLLKVNPIFAVIFALLMASVEYFLVDELREEGDLGNPLIILFIFSLIYFFSIEGTEVIKTIDVAQHLLIGLGAGVVIGLLSHKIMKSDKTDFMHEIGLLAMAIIAYTAASIIGGSGLLAVMISGMMYGNSRLRKRRYLQTLSDGIYKPMEVLIYLMIGFVVPLVMEIGVIWKAAVLFLVYCIIRIGVLRFVYKYYSWHNIMLLTLAPKGMTYAVVLMALTNYAFPGQLAGAMFWILLFSLFLSLVIENMEQQKIRQFERVFSVLKNLRYGRKRDIRKNAKKKPERMTKRA